MNDTSELEKSILKRSVLSGLFFAVFGVVWGVTANSGMMIFDGLYSMLSVFLAVMAIFVSKQVCKQEDETFPFGRSHFEPIMIFFKSLVLIMLCGYALIGAVKSILHGGKEMNMSSAVVYSIISVSGCFLTYLSISKQSKKTPSELLKAEANQWLGDTLLSCGVLAGFASALVLMRTSFAGLVKYADPIMVLAAGGFFVRVPIKTLIKTGKELLSMAPDEVIVKQIKHAAQKTGTANGMEQFKTHSIKSGRELIIEINYLLPGQRTFTVEEMDGIRTDMVKQLNTPQYKTWLNVSFTTQSEWY